MKQPRQYLRPLLAVLVAFSLAAPLPAWNATGHRIVAAIAYDRLTPAARARVDKLIQEHPDYTKIFIAGAAAGTHMDPASRAREAFLVAATWPDMIRGDARFYDETKADAVPTPLLPGFASMGRHYTWHYYDIPYAPDGVKPPAQLPPHALSELRRMLDHISMEAEPEAAYDLPWLAHLVGDVHQPLHATSRYLQAQPNGDAGGNFVFVTSASNPGKNLHAYWDDSAGTDTSDAYVNRFASRVTQEYSQPPNLSANPQRWLRESFVLDKSAVYSFGLTTGTKDTGTKDTGTKEQPVVLSTDYDRKAQAIIRRRIALAGYRLAAVLNARFN